MTSSSSSTNFIATQVLRNKTSGPLIAVTDNYNQLQHGDAVQCVTNPLGGYVRFQVCVTIEYPAAL